MTTPLGGHRFSGTVLDLVDAHFVFDAAERAATEVRATWAFHDAVFRRVWGDT